MPDETPYFINFQPDTYDRVLSLLPEDRASRILDVGAGYGYFSRQLKDRGYKVDACDFLEENFRCPDIPFFKADLAQEIPVDDDSYDVVVSIEVIEHLENHFRFMDELIRVTRPGGIIIITTPNVQSFPSRWSYFWTGYNHCAPYPLDPTKSEYFMEHINPIGVPELLFHFERGGAELIGLTTNRVRSSAVLPMLLFYGPMRLAMRMKFLRQKHRGQRALYGRAIRWVMHPANLMGRITIAVGRKKQAAGGAAQGRRAA